MVTSLPSLARRFWSFYHIITKLCHIHSFIKDVDKASVYRTLNLLEELGIVNIENFNNEKLYCLSADPHHHIICKKCGFSEEVPCTYEHYNFSNFSNVQHQMTLTGVCNKCNK